MRKMKINKQNYPEFFLDYHEGRLPEADRAKLMDFLARHPELKEEFEAFGAVSLNPDQTVGFPGKDSLKRGEVTAENYDWYFAAYISGDLSPSEKNEVEYFAEKKPKYARDLALMKHTLLQPDSGIVFEGKNALKRHVLAAEVPVEGPSAERSGSVTGTGGDAAVEPGRGSGVDFGRDAGGVNTRRLFPQKIWYYASAAAVIMMIAGLFFIWESQPDGPGLAFEIPAEGTVDQPEAVAEVPPSQQVRTEPDTGTTPTRTPETGVRPPATGGQTQRIPAEAAPVTRTPATGTSGTVVPSTRTPASGTSGTGTPGATPDRGASGTTPATGRQSGSPQTAPIQITTGPTLAAMAPSRDPAGFKRALPDVRMEQRTEFAYWDARMVSADALLAAGYDLTGGQPANLSQLAKNRLQESLPINLQDAETRLAEGGNNLRDLARSGVGTLGRLASAVVNPQPLPEEEGREVQFALGNVLRISRTASPE